jgi:hypothetical protein
LRNNGGFGKKEFNATLDDALKQVSSKYKELKK